MCGISGIINKNNTPVVDAEIKKATDIIKHRGPDDQGYYFYKNIAFGHRRLSILDLTRNGHQPMSFSDYTITYNGEIYNYLEIKQELSKDGYIFNSTSDTEVILASYDKWGEQCVNHFNGMWAFAIHDKRKNILFCSRDRFGIKPFYYLNTGDKFIFGSEIKQLLQFKPTNYINKKILSDYLFLSLEEHKTETFFEEINKLPASHNLIYYLHDNKFELKTYFELKYDIEIERFSEKEAVDVLKDNLRSSIALRLRSDVPIGITLSGGLDSSSIAAIISKELINKDIQKKLIAIHAKSIEKKTDESVFAREVSKACKIKLVEITPDCNDFIQSINDVIYTQEEPFAGPSVFMQYFVMQTAKKLGYKVLIDGQGADEILCGYESYYSVFLAQMLTQWKLTEYFKTLYNVSPFSISKYRIVISSILKILSNKTYFFKSCVIRKNLNPLIDIDKNIFNQFYKFNSLKDSQKRDLMFTSLPHLLKYEDKNSMRHSIETRLPFTDYRLILSAISINDSLKFKNGYLKYLQRKTIQGILPSSVVWRKTKFGFEAPTNTWIQNYKSELIKQINKSDIIPNSIKLHNSIFNNKKILWKLFNIAKWEELYNVHWSK